MQINVEHIKYSLKNIFNIFFNFLSFFYIFFCFFLSLMLISFACNSESKKDRILVLQAILLSFGRSTNWHQDLSDPVLLVPFHSSNPIYSIISFARNSGTN